MYTGVSGTAVARAADAMLRALGGVEVSLLFPGSRAPGDSSTQLGLVDPGTEEVRIAPVITRTLATDNAGPRQRLEMLFSSLTVSAEMNSRNIASAEALFDSALGVVFKGDLFHIEGVATEYFAGAPYLFRVVVVE